MIGSINQPPATITSNTRASSYGISRGAMIPEVERAVRNASLISPKRAQNRTPGSFFSPNRVVQTHLVRPRLARHRLLTPITTPMFPSQLYHRPLTRRVPLEHKRAGVGRVQQSGPLLLIALHHLGIRVAVAAQIAGTDHCVLRGEPGHEFLGGRGAAAVMGHLQYPNRIRQLPLTHQAPLHFPLNVAS